MNWLSRGLINKQDDLRPSWSVFVCLVFLLCIAGSLVVARCVPIHGGLFDRFNPFLVDMVSSVWHCVPIDHRRILLAHKFFLMLICLSVLVLSWSGIGLSVSAKMPAAIGPIAAVKMPARVSNHIIVLGVLAFFWWSFATFQGEPTDLIGGFYCLVSLVLLLTYIRHASRLLVLALAGFLIILASVPALFLPPDFAQMAPIEIVQLQQHYAVCFSFADQMAAGINPGASWLLHYGVLGPLVLGSIEKFFGPISFRGLVQLVEVSQFAFLAVVFGSLFYLARGRKLIALLALIPVIPWYHCNQLGILYPNHSGLRLIAVFVAIAVVCTLNRLPIRKLAVLMGFVAGLAVLYNFETGLTLMLGFGVSLFLRRSLVAPGLIKPLAVVVACLLVGLSLAIALFSCYFFVVTGSLPYLLDPAKLSAYFSAPQMITTPGMPAGIAVLMFVQSGYILLAAANKPPASISFSQALKAGIALMLLVWEMYYFNRPYYSNLASCWALYSILLIDSLRALRLGLLGSKRFASTAILSAVALLVVIAPYIIKSYRESAQLYGQVIERLRFNTDQRVWAESQGIAVSGVRFPKKLGQYVLDKAAELRQIATESSAILIANSATNSSVNAASRQAAQHLRYVSIYSLALPKASGVQQDFPYIDPYFGLNLTKQYRQYLIELVKDEPKFLLVDRPECDPTMKDQAWYAKYIKDVELNLAKTYHVSSTSNAWKVWQRN